MNKKHIAVTAAAIIGILALVTIAIGINGGVTAAEDERFRISGTTLTKYLGTDTFVSIPDTVSTIGEGAFSGNKTMTGVEIPSSVTTISYNAFKNCTALTSVVMPSSVKKVGPGAFEGCTALAAVEIGKNVSSWGTGVFTNCDSLAKVNVDNSNEYITYYNGALYNGNMTMLYQVLPAREGENYVMPETVKDMDAYALWDLKNTKNVKVSSAVTNIPKSAMTNMGSVENVVLQDKTTGIGEKAFANNANLKQVAIPSSVTSIDKKAFSGSSENLKIFTTKSSTADTFGKNNSITVIYEAEYPTDFMDSNAGLEEKPNVGESKVETPATEEASEKNSTVEPPETQADQPSTSANSSGWFQSPDGYKHPLDVPEPDNVIGKTVTVAGQAVFLINNHTMKVYGIPDGVQADVLTEQEAREQEAQEQAVQGQISADVTLPSSEKQPPSSVSINYQKENQNEIPQRKYYQQKDLTSYEIDKDITSIGRMAFAESGLKKIEIPTGVNKIEYGAFLGCEALTDVTIPDTVASIGTKAFERTAWLNDWKNGTGEEDFLIVGDGVLLAYRGNNAHVTIPDGVKQIGSETFKGHTEILDVAVPASVTKICAEAFRNCSSLTGLTGCEGLRTVIRGAFYGTQLSETEFSE